MTKCVGAFLRPCSNETDTILCAECWDHIDKTMSPTRNRAVPRRFSPRPRNGVAVQAR